MGRAFDSEFDDPGCCACLHCHRPLREHADQKCLYLPTSYIMQTCKFCGEGFDPDKLPYRDTPTIEAHPQCWWRHNMMTEKQVLER